MTRVLQLSDTHLVAPGALVSGRLDTARLLRQAVARIAGLLPLIAPGPIPSEPGGFRA